MIINLSLIEFTWLLIYINTIVIYFYNLYVQLTSY